MVFSRRVFVYCYLNKGVIVFVLMVLLYYCYLLAYIHNEETKKQHKPGRNFCSVIISMFFRLSSLFPSFATPSLLRVLFNYLFIIVPQSLPGTSTSELSLCLSYFPFCCCSSQQQTSLLVWDVWREVGDRNDVLPFLPFSSASCPNELSHLLHVLSPWVCLLCFLPSFLLTPSIFSSLSLFEHR